MTSVVNINNVINDSCEEENDRLPVLSVVRRLRLVVGRICNVSSSNCQLFAVVWYKLDICVQLRRIIPSNIAYVVYKKL